MDPDLADLRWHWGSAYSITKPGPDIWVAQRRDNREVLEAENPSELRDLILVNYFANPVPRP